MTILANVCSEMLSSKPFFSPYLDEEETSIVSRYMECKNVALGDVLWCEGDISSAAAFVIKGKIEVKKETEFSGKHVIVGIYGEGSVVGELCLLSGDRRAVTATALTDAFLFEISAERFDALMTEYPVIGGKLLKGMFLAVSIRLRKSFERLAAIF